MQTAVRRESGFTLVEIAIVLVIIGLILGGVLKGQELVTSARVRNIADQQNAIKAAFFAFQDRYKALPGDYKDADTNIPGIPSGKANGDGDGFINCTAGCNPAKSSSEPDEQVFAYLHLAAAGFISCSQCITNGVNGGAPSISNSPTNAFGGALGIGYDQNFGPSATPPNFANNVKTGDNIPSNVLAEVDSKLDDGNPYSGSFQYSAFSNSDKNAEAGCVTAASGTAPASWNRQTPYNNCGAAYSF